MYCNRFQVHISQITEISRSQLSIESFLSEIGHSFESVSCYECDDFLEAPSDTTPVILSDKLFIFTAGESITDSIENPEKVMSLFDSLSLQGILLTVKTMLWYVKMKNFSVPNIEKLKYWTESHHYLGRNSFSLKVTRLSGT